MNRVVVSLCGAALIELLVALLLFATVAAATAGTLASAQRSRAASGQWMRASELAGELLERVRADPDTPETEQVEGFERSWQRQPSDRAGLERCDVSVRWTGRGEHTLTLSAFLRSVR